ncbi:hypothetical protein NUM_44350 [Actinocatenispora comari]|uniref:Uncharacterized protein n=1 Tax=Actinocatenispora comari TaxID=2807577 RepID=A0A8J4EM47_9ACTN|nr:hypothetical protein NUM_44350 [Actinocatenispora comari]
MFDWANLWSELEVHAGPAPDWLVPGANDEYSNLFCLSLRGPVRGQCGSGTTRRPTKASHLPRTI